VEGVEADLFCEVLREEYETTVVPGRFFEMPDRVRISLVAQPEVMREGLGRIDAALGQLGARLTQDK
jgi:aspartate/methionine/tyrosine aminotransferase